MREHRGFLFALRFALNRILVRSSGFEPPRYCYRQPLKLVRLPVPPRPLVPMQLTSSEVRLLCETPIIGGVSRGVNIRALVFMKCVHEMDSRNAFTKCVHLTRPTLFSLLQKVSRSASRRFS